MGNILIFKKPEKPQPRGRGSDNSVTIRITHLTSLPPAEKAENTKHQFERALEDICVPILRDLTEWANGGHPFFQKGRTLRTYLKIDTMGSSLDNRVIPGLHGLALMGIPTVNLEQAYQAIRQRMRSLAVRATVLYKGQPKQAKELFDAELIADARRLLISAARLILDALDAGRFEYRLTDTTRMIVALAKNH